ncbi:Hypothetical predicted protein [Mytilus galloprovincialis]|uniref:Ependymin-related protein n=1 Tax=Mytilus galloprovincialis TaxID=29158 RepID=A0A8B6DRI0_MYTGA|nr:Hypothetical predicted protein [Mytilus galloprovincialis]
MKYCVLLMLIPFCVGADPSCCMPRQATYSKFTVTSQFDQNGFHSFEKKGKVYMDFDNKRRIDIVRKTENGQSQNIVAYTDYNIGKTYEVVDGHCTIKDALLVNGSMPANCFPGPNARNYYIGRETLGDTLTDVWRTDLTQSHGFMAVMHVSVKDCLLMTEIDYGTIQGVKIQSTTVLSDAVPRIDNQNVFQVPRECHHQS